MNIFVLSKSRKKAVKYYVNSHVIKIIIEFAQLLCTAVWCTGVTAPYKKTHVNHPCAIWARKSKKNWRWLKGFGLLLCEEYTYRYGKIHKTQNVIENLKCPELDKIGFTELPQCMPDEYKVEGDSVQAYRNYYNNEKNHLFAWKKRNVPYFISEE